MLADGTAVVAALVEGARLAVWVAPPGGAFAAPQIVSPAGAAAVGQSLAAGSDGGVVLAFNAGTTTSSGTIGAAVLAPGATAFGPVDSIAATSGNVRPVAGAGAGGRAAVAWDTNAVHVSFRAAG
jgi:hypothetical protein